MSEVIVHVKRLEEIVGWCGIGLYKIVTQCARSKGLCSSY